MRLQQKINEEKSAASFSHQVAAQAKLYVSQLLFSQKSQNC
jgi:hypothetical protein